VTESSINSCAEHFARRLRFLRGSNTQRTIERAIGLPDNLWHSWEARKRRPGFNNLLRIAEHFEVSLDWLMTGQDYRQQDRAAS
jgi:transcriptional regulator with XRE-family HTH domain